MTEDAKTPAEEEGTPEGTPEGAEGTPEGQQPGDSSGQAGDGKPKEEPTITESALKARMARAKKKWEQDAEEARKREQMSAEERLKAEKDEAERNASERVALADKRLIQAEARGVAAELGVRPDRISAAVRNADLSEVEVSDDGEPDARAIRAALTPVLKEFPEWGKPEHGKAPGNTPGGGDVPKGIDAEIQEAFDKGDFITAERLKRRKLQHEGKFKLGVS